VAPVVARDGDGEAMFAMSDRCPDEPEDFDGFEDEDGCVDRDNDGDGIPDAHEYVAGRWTNCDYAPAHLGGEIVDCRDMPEDRDGITDHDGCPDVTCGLCPTASLPVRLHIGEGGRLGAETEALLDEVAASMNTAPEAQFAVDAHVDAKGSDAANKRVTARVAAEVVLALVRRGVARERVTPRGRGEEAPIADNKTAEGRRANRRVEFIVLTECPAPFPPEDRRRPDEHVCV